MSPARTALTYGLFLDLVSIFFPLFVSMLLGLAFLHLRKRPLVGWRVFILFLPGRSLGEFYGGG